MRHPPRLSHFCQWYHVHRVQIRNLGTTHCCCRHPSTSSPLPNPSTPPPVNHLESVQLCPPLSWSQTSSSNYTDLPPAATDPSPVFSHSCRIGHITSPCLKLVSWVPCGLPCMWVMVKLYVIVSSKVWVPKLRSRWPQGCTLLEVLGESASCSFGFVGTIQFLMVAELFSCWM